MAVLTVYANGVTGGFSGRNTEPPKRGDIKGWSNASIRRNIKFLYSIPAKALGSDGWALTLTVRNLPSSPEAWTASRNAFFQRLRRLGITRCHWITEWQRRGVPHLHLCVWSSTVKIDAELTELLLSNWLEVTQQYGSLRAAQFATPIYDSLGWSQYVSKHASRGVNYYQRSPEKIPEGWLKMGKLWGKFGDWPVQNPQEIVVNAKAFYQLRRWVNKVKINKARQINDVASEKYLRSRYKKEPKQSAVMGLNEWIDGKLVAKFALELYQQTLIDPFNTKKLDFLKKNYHVKTPYIQRLRAKHMSLCVEPYYKFHKKEVQSQALEC